MKRRWRWPPLIEAELAREKTQNARHLETMRQLRRDRDDWRDECIELRRRIIDLRRNVTAWSEDIESRRSR